MREILMGSVILQPSAFIKEAIRFATWAHASIDQRRKYTNEPYIIHPAAVARLVSWITDDEAMIAAAWLHDVVEDTPVTIDEIRSKFGDDVASLVSDLTAVSKPEDGNRKTRKAIDLEHTATASPRAKTIKLADLVHNLGSVADHDKAFAVMYMREKHLLLAVLSEGDSRLFGRVSTLVSDYLGSEPIKPGDCFV
jgi:(p)ppGpp synthase/HD superfamily hydrolase